MRAATSIFGSEENFRKSAGRNSATILLETLAALALLVGAAVVIGAALNASIRSVERLRLNTHASSLAVSVLSELQLGTKSIASGPQVFDPPFDAWTWEVLTTPEVNGFDVSSQFSQVEVVVRHDEPSVTYRLCQRIQMPAAPSAAVSNKLAP